MNRIVLGMFLSALVLLSGVNSASADDAAAPSSEPTSVSTAPIGTTAAVNAAPAAADAAVAEAPAALDAAEQPVPLDNLDFASGEVASFDAATGKLDVKIYLDGAGDAKEQTISLTVDEKTEITNGDADLKSDALKPNAEIDVEYDTTNKKATYVFIY